MSVRVMSLVWDSDLPPMEKLVLLALADAANDEGHCWPSATTVARKSGQGERTVRRCVQSLIDKGHLTQQQRLGTSPIYTVHPCQSGTPARAAPLPDRPQTPARAAPKPLGTVNKGDKSPSKVVCLFACPDGVDPIDWDALKANRRQKRAALSEGAHRQITNKLSGWARDGWPPGPIVANAAERGWTTVFETDEMKGRNDGRQQQSNPRATNPTLDILRAANDAIARSEAGQDFGGTGPALPAPFTG